MKFSHKGIDKLIEELGELLVELSQPTGIFSLDNEIADVLACIDYIEGQFNIIVESRVIDRKFTDEYLLKRSIFCAIGKTLDTCGKMLRHDYSGKPANLRFILEDNLNELFPLLYELIEFKKLSFEFIKKRIATKLRLYHEWNKFDVDINKMIQEGFKNA